MSANFQSKMARGALWMILFKWVERGLGFISTLFLVRLLSPADFGIVSMALSFIFMAELLTAFSFDVALIQNAGATPRHFNSAWTANILLGGTITIGMLILAAPIARFYKEPRVLPLICILSLGPLVSAFENIGLVVFRKELDFRREFVFQVCRKLVGFSVTIPLAFLLHSYWALVAGTMASKLGGTLMSYWVQPFRPRFSLAEVPALLRFSKWLLLNNFINFLKERTSDFVIGRFYGPEPLGVYNVSNEFASLPGNEMGAPINRALLPGFAKMAGDSAAIRRAFDNATGMVAMMAVPAGCGIFAVAPFLVPVILGPKWLSGVPVMEVLSLNSALMVFHGTICTALVATGHPSGVTRTNSFFVAVLLVAMYFFTAKLGPLGAAFAVLLASVVSTPLYLYQLKTRAGVPVSGFFRAVTRPALASAVMIGAVRLSAPDYDLSMVGWHAGFHLAKGVMIGAVVYGACILALWWMMGRPTGPEQQVFAQLKSRAPAWLPVFGKGK